MLNILMDDKNGHEGVGGVSEDDDAQKMGNTHLLLFRVQLEQIPPSSIYPAKDPESMN